MNHVTNPFSSADINIFNQRSANFAISRNIDINCVLIIISNYVNVFFERLSIFLIKVVITLKMSAKIATLSLLEINIF